MSRTDDSRPGRTRSARRAHRRSNARAATTDAQPKMEMTPMIDVTFLLLIFFMCTLQFRTLEGALVAHLPRDVGARSLPTEPVERLDVRLDVLAEGRRLAPDGAGPFRPGVHRRFDLDARVVGIRVGPRRFTSDALDQVAAHLVELAAADPTRPVTIDARTGVAVADVVRVLDEVLDAGFTQVRFGASHDG